MVEGIRTRQLADWIGLRKLSSSVKHAALILHKLGIPQLIPLLALTSLDAEHAYMFASRGSDSTFNTYVATQPLKVLYFDGFSASKGNPGSLDLQKLIAFGIEEQPHRNPDPDRRPPGFEDGRIAAGLCEWGASHGIQGFVRVEATFELVWVSRRRLNLRCKRARLRFELRYPTAKCDFSQGVKLLHSVNTTRSDWNEHGPPGHPPPGPSSKTWTKGLPRPLGAPPSKESQRDYPGSNSIRQWQMLNAASWHYFSRDSRVHLDTQYLTTLTDAAYTSLRPIYDLPIQDRRIDGISHKDLAMFKEQLEFNIQAWHTADSSQSKADYLSIVDVIVDRTAGRLNRMKSAFKLSNSTEAVSKVKNEVFDILFPFVDVPRVLWEGKDRPDARTRYAALRHATKSCGTAYTSYLADETASSSERLMLSSVEGTLSRICEVATHILSDSLSMQVRTMSEGMRARYESKMLELWQEEVEALISWLDWPVWKTCEHACADDVSK